MSDFWIRKTPTWSRYYQKIEYISDPSIDLIERCKIEIITYENPKECKDYVPCDNVERSQGHLLFILGDRVEVIVKPHKDTRILYFIDCNDNNII